MKDHLELSADEDADVFYLNLRGMRFLESAQKWARQLLGHHQDSRNRITELRLVTQVSMMLTSMTVCVLSISQLVEFLDLRLPPKMKLSGLQLCIGPVLV